MGGSTVDVRIDPLTIMLTCMRASRWSACAEEVFFVLFMRIVFSERQVHS